MDSDRPFDAASLFDGFVLHEARGTTAILGGCHVGGRHVARDAAFPLLLQRAGGPLANNECRVFPDVSIRVATRRLRHAARATDLSCVILQLGHRETIRASRLPIAWRPRAGDHGDAPEPARLSSMGYAKAAMLGLALDTLGLDRLTMPARRFEERFTRDVEDMVDSLRDAAVRKVVLLSCFPTAKHRLNRKRLIANTVLRRAAKRAGFHYVDVWSALSFPTGPLRGFARPAMLSTPAHLNAEGHRVVADEIALAMAIDPPKPRSFRARRVGSAPDQASVAMTAAIAPASRAPR